MQVDLYFYADADPYATKEIEVSTFERSPEYSPYLVFIKKLEVTVPDVELPSRVQITKGLVSALESNNKVILAKAQRDIEINNTKIQQLLCIENKAD